jgi:DNA-directed RNA polymerase subunit beta'
MLSSNNILSPGSGRPLAMPSLDLVTGLFYLCGLKPEGKGAGWVFSSPAEGIMALDAGHIDLRAPIKVRLSGSVVPGEDAVLPEDYEPGTPWIADTTLGRVLFNELLPTGYPFVNYELPKKRQAAIVNDLAEHYPMSVVAQTLDRLKEAGFHWATRSGMTVAIGDVIIPPEKEEILLRHEIEAERVEKAYQRGNLSHAERNDDLVKIWEAATKEIEEAIPAAYPKDNPVYILVAAGAAGNWIQVRSLAGMKGVVANSKGQQIPRPIRSSFREGLSVL